MNRLRGMTTYLAGPMDRVEGGGVEWRDWIIPHLAERGVRIFNPCNKPVDIAIEDEEHRRIFNEYKDLGEFDKIREMGYEIRNIDLRMVDLSDFLIVNLDMDAQPCGTFEEAFWANREMKPVLFRCPHGKHKVPTWMYLTFPSKFFFDTWEDLIGYLDHIDSAPEVERLKRWVFFDYSRMVMPLSTV